MLKDLTWVIFFTSFSTTRSTGISILPTQTFSINVNFFEKLLSLSLSIHHFTQVHLLAVIRIRIIFFTKKNCDTIKMTSKPQWTIKYLKGKSDKNLKPWSNYVRNCHFQSHFKKRFNLKAQILSKWNFSNYTNALHFKTFEASPSFKQVKFSELSNYTSFQTLCNTVWYYMTTVENKNKLTSQIPSPPGQYHPQSHWTFAAYNPVYSQILCSVIFKKIGIHPMQGWTATTRHRVVRKRSIKRLKHTGNLFR